MKFLNIIPEITVKFGGPVTTMDHLNQLWLSAGHAVEILTIQKNARALPIVGQLTAVASSFPARFGNSNEAAHWLAQQYAKFDLIFVHGIWTAINLRSALFLNRKRHPYVVIPHGSLDPFDLQKKSALKNLVGPLFVSKVLAGSSAVLCSTQREADCLVAYGAKCQKMVLPWPVSPVRSQINRRDARTGLGIREDEFVILSLGRIDYKKGFPVLLPAVKRLLHANPRTRLLIVGPDSNGYIRVAQHLVQQLGLQGAVTFVPAVVGEEKIRLQRAADCFALPSLNENFGNTVVEAMQQGLPCVISNNVYICDTVENGKAGFVCQYDEQEVFAALKKLSENPGLRAGMAEAAIETAKEFEPDRLKDKYLAMLKRVLERQD